MKKLTITKLLLVASSFATSCKKDWTCRCEGNIINHTNNIFCGEKRSDYHSN